MNTLDLSDGFYNISTLNSKYWLIEVVDSRYRTVRRVFATDYYGSDVFVNTHFNDVIWLKSYIDISPIAIDQFIEENFEELL
jgi:hypothetical protein